MAEPRVLVVLLDGVGCGALPDADQYGDAGSNTLANTARAVGGLDVPHLARLGLGNIIPIDGVRAEKNPKACVGRMAEQSKGKDSTTGHWEVAGVVTDEPFPVFPHGFPDELVKEFEAAIGRRTIGNVPASGTEIVERLGKEHLSTGCPIVYTSADSVFQIACHEDVIPPAELYRICETARRLLTGSNRVARVIARPFTGRPGSFKRTPRRKDLSCPPSQPTLLDNVSSAGKPVVGIGKVDDLFAHQGFTETHHSVSDDECLDLATDALKSTSAGLIFANFVQFDMDWGHRNDAAAFAQGLADFDRRLPEVTALIRPGDLAFIAADHGNDPTTPSTDHSREYVPLLVFGPGLKTGVDLGTRTTFADLGQTAADYLGVKPTRDGTSFLKEVTK